MHLTAQPVQRDARLGLRLEALFKSTSAFVPEIIKPVSPPITVNRIVMLTRSSINVKPLALESRLLSRSPGSHREPRFDLRESAPCNRLAPRADAPELLLAPVDGDQRRERLGAARPAEAGAGDDPVVLVEPVVDRASACAWGAQPPRRELLGAGGRGDLVERLFRRAGDDEVGLAGSDALPPASA